MNYGLPVLHSRLWTESHSHIDIDQLSLHNVQQCILPNAETNVDLTHTYTSLCASTCKRHTEQADLDTSQFVLGGLALALLAS